MKLNRLLLVFLVFMVAFAPDIFAGSTGMPWETPGNKIVASLTGPTAFIITVGGVVISGIALVFGSEFSEFVKATLKVALGGSFLAFAAQIVAVLFGISGATI